MDMTAGRRCLREVMPRWQAWDTYLASDISRAVVERADRVRYVSRSLASRTREREVSAVR